MERAGSLRGRAVWLCKCECGKETVVRGGNLRAGQARSCGCKKGCWLPSGEAAFLNIFRTTKWWAYKRNLEFSLTKEQVKQIHQQSCHYCDGLPSNVAGRAIKTNGTYTYNGLDRTDNTKGYIIDNVVPCCIVCNRAKGKMTASEFKDWIKRLMEHNKAGSSGGLNESLY